MKSRLLKTVLTLVAPLVIEFLIKNITEKKVEMNSNIQIPSPH